MKKFKLISFNKDTLKKVAFTAGAIGCCLVINHAALFGIKKIGELKNETVRCESMLNFEDETANELNLDGKAINANTNAKDLPTIAIAFRKDGQVDGLLINYEYLTLEETAKKYPELIDGIRKHITEIYAQNNADKTKTADIIKPESSLTK